MAIIYVRSGATGLNNGTSWTDAYTSFSSATVAAAGDFVYVSEDHNQNYGATTTVTFSNGTPANPVKVLCVNHTTGLLTTGAVLTCGAGAGRSLAINGHLYVDGLNVTGDANCQLATTTTPYAQTWKRCTIGIVSGAVSGASTGIWCGGAGIGAPGRIRLLDCTLDLSNGGGTSQAIGVQGCSLVEVRGGSVLWKALQSILVRMGSNAGTSYGGGSPLCTLEDLDLSGMPGTVTEWGTGSSWLGQLTVRRCKTPATPTVGGTPQNRIQQVTFESTQSGTITVPPLGLRYQYGFFGNVQSDLAHYRTGGANDGSQANPYSWALAANANPEAVYGPLESPPMLAWVAGGTSITFTVYVASGVTLDNSLFWIELDGPDNTASPNTTATGYHTTTAADPLATPTNLTTDSVSTWNGTGVTVKQKVTVTYTPAVAGPVRVRAFLADPSVTVYIDPEIDDGSTFSRVWYSEGSQFAEVSSGGSGGGAPIIGSAIVRGIGRVA